VPFSPVLEKYMAAQKEDIIQAIYRVLHKEG
jgi:hypothetical protein